MNYPDWRNLDSRKTISAFVFMADRVDDTTLHFHLFSLTSIYLLLFSLDDEED